MELTNLDYQEGMPSILGGQKLRHVNPMFIPTAAQLYASRYVDARYEASKKYWGDKHIEQRRLYSRYRNSKLFNRAKGYSNMQIAQPHYIADVLSGFLVNALLSKLPYAKISAFGVEDFPGKQEIDRTHRWQHAKPFIKNPMIDILKMMVITGTGVGIPGWKYCGHEFIDKTPETMQFLNPDNPAGEPIQIETGKYNYNEAIYYYDHISMTSLEPWNHFAQAGGSGNTFARHHDVLRIKFFKNDLYEMQRAGFIKNVEYIDEAAYNAYIEDIYTESDTIKMARKEYTNRLEEKDAIYLLFYWGKFPYYKPDLRMVDDASQMRDDEVECLIIKPEGVDIVLKLAVNPYQPKRKPIILFPYEKLDGEVYGVSPLSTAEKLLQHNEDLFNMAQDAANREVYRRRYIPESLGSAKFRRNDPDGIIEVPDDFFRDGKLPEPEKPNQYVLPNLREQRAVTQNLIYEVTGAIDMLRGVNQNEESATKSTFNWKAMNSRMQHRMDFIESHGMLEFMEWQMVLNHQFLDDNIVAALCNIPPSENPFKQIVPILPMMDFDWIFEGSRQAAENPIKAQLIRGIIDLLPYIQPGYDELGRYLVPNGIVFLREFMKNLDFTDDIERFFMPISKQQADLRTQMLLGQNGGNGRMYETGGKTGALTAGNLAAGMNSVKSNDVRMKETG